MKEYKDVTGTRDSARPVVIGKHHIYEHTNIREVEVGLESNKKTVYMYDEVEYTKDEYLLKLISENIDLKNKQNITESALETLMTDMLPNTTDHNSDHI